jgi:DNA topoisomerase VI subunit B
MAVTCQKTSLSRYLRFANRVPLLYQQGACATQNPSWHELETYGLRQSEGSLPIGTMRRADPYGISMGAFHQRSEGGYCALSRDIKEMKLASRKCGRELGKYLGKKKEAFSRAYQR